MTDIPFPILVALAFLFGCLAVLNHHRRHQAAQRALPEREAYLAAHAQEVPTCLHCGSQQTEESGIYHMEDHRRVITCASCRRPMYQYSRPPSRAA